MVLYPRFELQVFFNGILGLSTLLHRGCGTDVIHIICSILIESEHGKDPLCNIRIVSKRRGPADGSCITRLIGVIVRSQSPVWSTKIILSEGCDDDDDDDDNGDIGD